MTRLITVFISALCISACATTGKPVVAATVPSAENSQTHPVVESQHETDSTQSGDEAEIHVVKLPPVEQSEIPIPVANENERVCRREMRTGSHRAVRVCRSRAEMMRLEEESKDTFKKLHRSQMQGN